MHGYLYIQSLPLRHAYIHSVWIKPTTTPFTAASKAFTDTAAPRFMNITNLPNFVKDINSRLLQQDIFNKGTWDGNLFSAGMNQVLSNVGFFHHGGAKILSSINHGLKQRLQCSIKRRERERWGHRPGGARRKTERWLYMTPSSRRAGTQQSPRVRLGIQSCPGMTCDCWVITDLRQSL